MLEKLKRPIFLVEFLFSLENGSVLGRISIDSTCLGKDERPKISSSDLILLGGKPPRRMRVPTAPEY